MDQKALHVKKMKKTSNLTLLPEEILLHIANFLPLRDVINLSVTCKWIKCVLPRFKLDVQYMKGPDTSEDDTRYDAYEFNPLHYFDTPPLKSSEHWKFKCVQRVVISMKWNDQVCNVI